ncbi:prephenate dehydrogenase/arogenate dehydrogenase family protein, partial [bacterium]|nr:prephenate dehydrogenase/arogenate dehydrogenase family protein [bacterium]
LITDVGSTKGEITRLAEKIVPPEINFIGGHPMAGSEKASFRAADPLLFENCFYILTPSQNTADAVTQSFAAIVEKIGAKTLILDAAEHDRIAAGISHLPQLLAVGLVNLVARYNQENPYYLKMAAGGFRDMTRIASSPYSIWEDICNTNQPNIAGMLTELIKELEKLRDTFEEPELPTEKLAVIFEHAARTRLSIPKDTKGFINPLYDLRVAVEDKPGMISRMSTICFENNINIRDIEVLKVRLLEGGTIRLSFDSEKDRQHATNLLVADGFECRIVE